jgi:hypothetical protein
MEEVLQMLLNVGVWVAAAHQGAIMNLWLVWFDILKGFFYRSRIPTSRSVFNSSSQIQVMEA